jgi:hypothetical protein
MATLGTLGVKAYILCPSGELPVSLSGPQILSVNRQPREINIRLIMFQYQIKSQKKASVDQ